MSKKGSKPGTFWHIIAQQMGKKVKLPFLLHLFFQAQKDLLGTEYRGTFMKASECIEF
jgi:hypothetical protein